MPEKYEKTYILTYSCKPNEDWNQPLHMCSLMWVFVSRMKKKLCILCYPKCAQWRFRSDCAKAQADLNLPWANISEDTFPEVVPNAFKHAISALSSPSVASVYDLNSLTQQVIIEINWQNNVSVDYLYNMMRIKKPQRKKTYLRKYGPSEDSALPAHSRSLIRIFQGRILENLGCKVSSWSVWWFCTSWLES